MLIEKIYKEVYSKLLEETMQDDLKMSDQLSVLAEETQLEQLDKKKLENLLCKAAIIGQEQGFISGVRFWTKLIREVMM